MKYSLLGVSTENELNIGDYVQALAASQFLPSIDGFIQRERLSQYQGSSTKMIMNGWYMHHPENWPPAPIIKPLFVAFHLNVTARKELLSKYSLEYFKANEPIGCRDYFTANLLKERGINAYFSGCLTLTLGYKYKSDYKDDSVYFVDPYFKTEWSLLKIFQNIYYLLKYWKEINAISQKYPERKKGLRKLLILTTFYKEYSKHFTNDTLLNATYINQQNDDFFSNKNEESEYLKQAETLIKNYSKARLVVTSRIHCALPCLGLETNVIYTEDSNQSEASRCRLDGLRELFTIMSWENETLRPKFEIKGKISIQNHPQNKTNWKDIANTLIGKCTSFVNS